MHANANQNETPLSTWALDREIVLSRVINAPRELVFSAWTDPHHLPQWFGPAGFRVETKSMDIRVNGEWRFDMIAPDGKRYTNRMQFRRIERPQLIEIDHGADEDNDPGVFRTTITFDEQSDGKTVITPVDEASREILRRKLDTLGGLERQNLLEADVDDVERQQRLAHDGAGPNG